MYAFGICVHKKLVCCVHRKILWTQILEFVSTKNCVDVSTGRFCGHRFGICVHKKLVCRIHLKVLWTQNREIVSTACVHTKLVTVPTVSTKEHHEERPDAKWEFGFGLGFSRYLA